LGTSNDFDCRCDSLSANAGADRELYFGDSTIIGTVQDYSHLNYAWTPTIWLSDATVAHPTAAPDSTNSNVLTVSDAFGCEETDTVTITMTTWDTYTDTSLVISAITIQDTVVHILWDAHPEIEIVQYVIERSVDEINFEPLDSILTSMSEDIMTMDLSEIVRYDQILYTTESGNGFIYNDIPSDLTTLFAATYRIRMDAVGGSIYSELLAPTIYYYPDFGMPRIEIPETCPSIGVPPTGYFPTGSVIEIFINSADGNCCIAEYTLYSSSENPTNCTPQGACVPGSSLERDCECGCTWDSCCEHLCTEVNICNCIWKDCSGEQSVYVVTNVLWDASSVSINPTPASICQGESITLSVDTLPNGRTVEWYEGAFGGTVIGTSNSITVSPGSTTTYTVYYYGEGENFAGQPSACFSELSTTVTVHPVPTAGITASQTIACGDSVNLTATGGGSYSWNTAPAQSTATITVSPITTTSYTATVTNAYGCTDEAFTTVTVTPGPAISITTDVLLTCDSLQLFAITDPDTTENYQWTVPTGVSISSGQGSPQIVVNWGSIAEEGGLVCVTAQTCGQTDCVQIDGCCDSIAGALVFTSITLTAEQTYTGEDILVNGILTLDDAGGTFVFSDCDIVMAANARIIVADGTNITLTDSTLVHACKNAHDGILMEGSTSSFVMNQWSHIMEADTALSFHNNPNIDIDEAIFSNNRIHTSIVHKTAGLTQIENSRFLGSGALAPPFSGEITRLGMYVWDTPTPWTFGPGNVIDGGRVGIVAVGAFLTVFNDTIRNMEPCSGCPLTISGYGIYAFSNLTLHFTVANSFLSHNKIGADIQRYQNASFKSVGLNAHAIYGANVRNNTTVEITSCHIDSSFVGVFSTLNGKLEVDQNTFDHNNFSLVSRFDGPHLGILKNDFTFDPAINHLLYGHSIWVANNTVAPVGFFLQGTFNANIFDNTTTNALRGIYLKDASWINVYDNDIHVRMHDDTPLANWESRGIHLDHTLAIRVNNNVVHSDVTDTHWGWWDTGIRTDNTAFTQIMCDTTRNLHIGIQNGGPANLTFMFDDVMDGYHHRGIVQNWGVLGQQGNPQNPTDVEWLGDFVHHTNTFNAQESNDFFVRFASSGTPFFPSGFVATSSQGSSQFEVNPIQAANGAESEYDCPVDFRGLTHLHRLALDSVIFYGEDSLITERLSKLELFRAICADSILQLDSILIAFRDTFVTSDLGRLDTLSRYMTLEIPKTEAAKLAGQMNTLVPQDTIASLWKDMLTLAFHKWADDDTTTVLTSSDSTRLWDVGALCPYFNGPAVYLARTMLFSLDSVWFALRNECEAVQEPSPPPSLRLAQAEDEGDANSEERLISVYPNPTEGLLVVRTIGYEDDSLTWEVHDLTGRNLLQGILKSADIDVRTLLSGIYVLRISANDREEYKDRFVLIK
jgi:parallel beta-helix repeat protein